MGVGVMDGEGLGSRVSVIVLEVLCERARVDVRVTVGVGVRSGVCVMDREGDAV